jgi:hypothetical protein
MKALLKQLVDHRQGVADLYFIVAFAATEHRSAA